MEVSVPSSVSGSTLVSQYSDSESESEDRDLSSTQNSTTEYSLSSTVNTTQGFMEGEQRQQEPCNSASSDDSERDSTSADDGGSEDTSEDTQDRWRRNRRTTLSNPFSSSVVTETTAVSGTESVFNVPFRTSEDLQSTLLQHHVKLTPNHKQQLKLNGKKICWSHRKGKCRFGHKCTFAHDTDLSQDSGNTDTASQGDSSTKILPAFQSTKLTQGGLEDTVFEQNKRTKKRPGLSQTLIPGKKVMSQYYRT